MQANKFSVYPVVGQSVEVKHRSELDRHGLAKLKTGSTAARVIAKVYLSDDGVPVIQDNAGDVWSVKPGRLNTRETFVPQV